jgi:hypothetical protein
VARLVDVRPPVSGAASQIGRSAMAVSPVTGYGIALLRAQTTGSAGVRVLRAVDIQVRNAAIASLTSWFASATR